MGIFNTLVNVLVLILVAATLYVGVQSLRIQKAAATKTPGLRSAGTFAQNRATAVGFISVTSAERLHRVTVTALLPRGFQRRKRQSTDP